MSHHKVDSILTKQERIATMGTLASLLVLIAMIAASIGVALWGPLQVFLRAPEFLPVKSV